MNTMTPEQLEQNLLTLEQEITPVIARFTDVAKTRIAATSTQEYMQDGGFYSPPFPPRRSRSGPLRILSGRLARSLTGARSVSAGGGGTSENINKTTISKDSVRWVFGTSTPYANVHEEGFIGHVQVPAHQRTIVQAFGKPLSKKTTFTVAAHERFMTIPARPYLQPSLDDNLKWLQNKLAEEMEDLTLKVIEA